VHGLPIFGGKKNMIQTNRPDSFSVPHKGIRNALLQLSVLAGQTDCSNSHDVRRLKELGREVFLILTTHAQDENDVSLTELEKKLGISSHHDREEHEKIEAQQAQLEELLEKISLGDSNNIGKEFYVLLNRFIAVYFAHMNGEETLTQELLWKHFTDEELAGHRQKIMKNLDPDVLLLWFKFIIPAMSLQESVGLLSGFKANAPASFFQRSMGLLKEVLGDHRFGILESQL
jgi:hypothetical protein